MSELTTLSIEDLGRLLKEKRKALMLTQTELADLVESSASYISDIERGRTIPTLAFLRATLAALGYYVHLSIYPIGEENSPNNYDYREARGILPSTDEKSEDAIRRIREHNDNE